MPEHLATGDVLRRFLDRIGRDLAEDPLDLEPEAHRRRLAQILTLCGSGNHYEVLGISPEADEAAVYDAFRDTARAVHPSLAARSDLRDREGVLQVLFERVTEAYLALGDPQRRDTYDRLVGVEEERRRESPERIEETRRVAEELYVRARDLVRRDDYHFAIELLRQAARLEPRDARIWGLLGRAQRANPTWLHMAADSLRRAVQLAPDDPAYRHAFAEVSAERGDSVLAKEQFQEVLRRHPEHPDAADALAAIEAADSPEEGDAPRRGRLFRRKR